MVKLIWNPLESMCKRFHKNVAKIMMYPNLLQMLAKRRDRKLKKKRLYHDDAIKWKHFPRYWPFVPGIHLSPGEFPAQRPLTRSFDVLFRPEPTVEQTMEALVIWDAIALIMASF